LTINALEAASGAKFIKNLAASIHTGLPGGCPGCIPVATAIYSGQSQYDAVGSIVRKYVQRAAISTPKPVKRRITAYLSREIYLSVVTIGMQI